MKIKILDKGSMGDDLNFDVLRDFGEVEIYDRTEESLLEERISDAEVIIINKIKITKELLKTAKALKLICVFATGYDNVDLESAKKQGVAVCNVPAYSTDSVVLYTVATVLSLAARLNEYTDFVKSGEYRITGLPNRITPVFHEIKGKTWGIVGYGNIGRAVGEVARALGANVIVNKRTPTDDVECVDIDTLCKRSDIITLHTPLNDATRNLIDKNRLALMKQSVILVNEARGAVVSEADVADAVTNGMIGAFGCDVYSKEPFGSDHPYMKIIDFPNVILTPHSAWGALEARERCLKIIHDNINAFIEGKFLNRVDI